jgi:hypothetical protein
MRVRISQLGLVAGAAAIVVAVAGCGQSTNNAQPQPSSSSAPTSSSSEAPTSSSTVPASPSQTTQQQGAAQPGDNNGLCKAADLKLSIGRGDAAAGTVYKPLVFTNISDHSCVIQGFPGVSYVGGADGHQVGAAAFRAGDKGGPITLGKGDTASAAIGFVNVQNYDASTCQPQPVRGLRVYPPQETASMFVDLPGTGCGNEKIPGNQLTVKTIVKGANAS